MANDIQHFGVLGMKWGRRKARTPGEHLRDSVKQKYGGVDPKGHFKRSLKQKYNTSPEQIKQKSENLIQLAKKKISDLPDNQKKALVFTAAFAGTLATTVALAKGSDVLVSALQQRSYDAAIRDIASVIIESKRKG